MEELEFPYTVSVSWKDGDTMMSWNEKCAWVIENVGLPGHRYVYHATWHNMTFSTKTEEDACFIALKCS